MRAEVGLLTRNVKVRGSINEEFTREVEACAAGFNPGQFDTQTCFHGRYGPETVTDQFGATIMLHAKYQDQHLVVGRLSYIEVTEAGQAFRLGRYPIHYHLNGNVTGSYVRGCAVHRTYNRAVTIHAVDHLLVEHNVAYDNMGHAFFTEDGIERFNIIQYNLAVFTRTSSSLLNVDVTPASFWVVNPTNIVRHNAAAGGTHFGFWYRLERHPSGPSFTTEYCPMHAPMAEFFNNSAHSFGRYGLWVFSMDGYFPYAEGSDPSHCTGDPGVARWGQFLAWRCERGAEVVFGGQLRFENFTVVDNEMSGLEMVKVEGAFGDDGPGVKDALIVGRSELAGDACTERGLITPKQYIFSVDGVQFVNFDRDNCAAIGGCSQCKPLQGGFQHQMRRLSFENSPNKLAWKWTHESVYYDTDGSLSGVEDGRVLPWSDILDPALCSHGPPELGRNPDVLSAVCQPSVSIHRMAWNGAAPSTLDYKTVNVSSPHGTTSLLWKKKRLTHPRGWMALLAGGEDYQLVFEDAEQLTNISYTADFYFLSAGQRLAVSHQLLQRPDRLATRGAAVNASDTAPLDWSAGAHGDLYWNNDTYTLSYLVAGGAARRRRAAGPYRDRAEGATQNIQLRVYRCYFDDCQPPPPPVIPTGRPDTVQLWSQATEDVWAVPAELEDVTIPADLWVVADVPLPPMRRLTIYGVLEIDDDEDNVLSCTHIVVYGKLMAGSQASPFRHNFTVLLRGRHARGEDGATADLPMPAGAPNLGWKAMGVFGSLELHGERRTATWTKLSSTAAAGDTSLQLEASVDWPVGCQIVVSTTSFEARETERVTVSGVSDDGRTLTIVEPLQHLHLGQTFLQEDGSSLQLAAKVGLLSHNVRIKGEEYDGVVEESFGARVIAGSYFDADAGSRRTATVGLSNVEFALAGQEGWSDSYDPRYALAFHSVEGAGSGSRVVNCSFNHVFSPAVGLFYSANVTLDGNVVYHTVGSAIIDAGTSNIIRNNLVALMLFPGLYNGRSEPENLSWDAGFRVHKATDLTMSGNVVAGSERLGFHISAEDCAAQSKWSNNEAHAVLQGVHMFKSIPFQCAQISGFYVWRAWDYGIYFDVPASSVTVRASTVAEATLGVLGMFYQPDPARHQFADKSLTIADCRLAATAAADQCSAERPPVMAGYWTKSRAPRAPGGGRTGLYFGQFIAGKVGAPFKPWHNPMSYPALRGATYLTSVDFYNFNNDCGRSDVAISTHATSDDAQHPVVVSALRFHNQRADNKLFIHEPRLAVVNPSDCVDMDCDGHKHAMLVDTDGSLMDSAGTIVPMAEFEFGGDARRGLSYDRVPESAVTNLDGSRIDYAAKMPNKGVWRGASCAWRSSWRAYTCPGGDHRMLVIESMDADSELRRVSPVALIANPGPAGFLDLLNGPQDMGWCFGYTCQERLSTFFSIVAPAQLHELHFTGTPPQHLRFHLLHATDDQAIVLKIWYPKKQRYDVYYEGQYVLANNVEAATFNIIPAPDGDQDQYIPAPSSPNPGENYFDRAGGFLYVLVRGPGLVEVQQQPVIALTLNYVSEDDFFESDVQQNLLAMLGIAPSQLRVVNVIREDAAQTGRRRRRSATQTTVEFEIGNAPQNSSTVAGGGGGVNSSDTNSTAAGGTGGATSGTTSSPAAAGGDGGDILTAEQLSHIQATMVDSFQTGQVDGQLGVQVTGVEMVDPEPVPTDPTGGVRATNETGGPDLSGDPDAETFSQQQRAAEQQVAAASAAVVEYSRPDALHVKSTPIAGTVASGVPLSPAVTLYMTAAGEAVTELGHSSEPWRAQAELVSAVSGVSLLNTVAQFDSNGEAVFSGLTVRGGGSGLQLRFRIVRPDSVNFSTTMAGTFASRLKQLEARLGSSALPDISPGAPISLRVYLYDPESGAPAAAADTGPGDWLLRASLYRTTNLHQGTLTGTLSKTFTPPADSDEYTVEATFDNLAISPASRAFYLLQFTVSSVAAPSRSYTVLSPALRVRSPAVAGWSAQHRLQLSFDAPFAAIAGRHARFGAEACNWLSARYAQLACEGATFAAGSILAQFATRAESEDAYQAALQRLQTDADRGLAFTDSDGVSYPLHKSITVDGTLWQRTEDAAAMPPWAIVVIVLLAILLLLCVVWLLCFYSVRDRLTNKVNSSTEAGADMMSFKVPINTVPPPPFTPGNVSSFNVRMAIRDPHNRVAPSVIQVTSDDPLVDMQLEDFNEHLSSNPSPRLATSALPNAALTEEEHMDQKKEEEERQRIMKQEEERRRKLEEQDRLMREEQAAQEAEARRRRETEEEEEERRKREAEQEEADLLVELDPNRRASEGISGGAPADASDQLMDL